MGIVHYRNARAAFCHRFEIHPYFNKFDNFHGYAGYERNYNLGQDKSFAHHFRNGRYHQSRLNTRALFFSTAAGALLYVVVELTKRAYSPKSTVLGIIIGILLMYITDLLLSI